MGEIIERALPETAFEWTGERLTTGVGGQIEIEHLHRYLLARDFCRGLDVLDVASGEGYGTSLLAAVAKSAVGVEISAEVVEHAARHYRSANLHFLQGDAREIPLGDASVDVVVSFETIEHFYEQESFLSEVRRVLRPNGCFIVSSPDRDIYSPPVSPVNPYHKRELSRIEFESLLGSVFPHVRILSQRPMLGSVILTDYGEAGQTITIERRGETHFERSNGVSRAPYLLAVASAEAVPPPPNSIFVETGEIGPLIARAAEHEALATALGHSTQRAEQAEAALTTNVVKGDGRMRDASGAQAGGRKEGAASDVDEPDAAWTALVEQRDAAETKLKQACAQRDAARLALRRSHLVATSRLQVSNHEWQARFDQAELGAREWQMRLDRSELSAREWHARYDALRGRIEGFLFRSGLYRVSRMVPPWLRRSIVARVFKSDVQ